MTRASTPGEQMLTALQKAREQQQELPFVGIYDLFCASLAAEHFGALSLSIFGLAASAYRLHDIGFIDLGDLTINASRLRALLPIYHLLVDIDDGYGDAVLGCHVARSLERWGTSGVVIQDQAKLHRCSLLNGKFLLLLSDNLINLDTILRNRSSLVVVEVVVVVRTAASDWEEVLDRGQAFDQVEGEAVLAEAIMDLALIAQLRDAVQCPVFCNVIAGGKVPVGIRADLAECDVQGLSYSTPSLFAVEAAFEQALYQLNHDDADFSEDLAGPKDFSHCIAVFEGNHKRVELA